MSALTSAVPLRALARTSETIHELSAADRVIRQPLPLSRRLSVVQLRGGVGASATAAALANLFARRRAGMVLAVDAAGAHSSMAHWHAGLPVHAVHTGSERRTRARNAADARDGLPRTPSGAYALDLRAMSGRPGRPDADDWHREVDPISRFYDVVVTDWGVRLPETGLGTAATASHALCLVARSDRSSIDEAVSVIPAIREQEPAMGILLAIADVAGVGERRTRALAERTGVPVARIPHDGARGAARPVASRSLRATTRIAHARLAAALLASSQPNGEMR